MNEHVRALLRNRSTVARALGDATLERLAGSLPRKDAPRTLVAGGGRASGGSERFVLRALGPTPRVVFSDITAARRPDVLADLSRPWPFRDGAFDLVVSTWVIEHVPDPRLFVAEAARVLGAEGTFVCAAPFLYRKHGSPEDYHRFTDTALARLAAAAGFSRVEVQAVGGTPLVCCVNTVWPLIPLPGLGLALYGLARGLDASLQALVRLLGRSQEVVASFPLGYVCLASLPAAGGAASGPDSARGGP
jgi:SAM-dependent methyltransferase